MESSSGEDGEIRPESGTKKPNFIADEDHEDEDEEEEEEDGIQFDSVCAICDNGGELLSCEGKCMRSFHATKEAGAESDCESLKFSNARDVHALSIFYCNNCLCNRHQCFLCGKLGSSDLSSAPEVFSCANATCGHFYHPQCVAKKLHPEDEAKAKTLQDDIAVGEMFICPAHNCFICKQNENKKDDALQFATCRRCPKSYHRKCLPELIYFSAQTRVWEGLLPDNRILIYCMDHKIIESLATPLRNHVVFSDTQLKMKKPTALLVSSKERDMENKSSWVSEYFPAKETAVKKYTQVSKDTYTDKNFKQKYHTQGFAVPLKQTVQGLSLNVLNVTKSGLVKSYKSDTGETAARKVESISSLSNIRSYPDKPKQQHKSCSSYMSVKPAMRAPMSSRPLVYPNLEKRMMALIEKSNASFDEEKFRRKFNVASTNVYSAKYVVDKITQGTVDASVKAIRTALKKLEDGGSIEQAQRVCEPEILKKIMIWKKKFRVYLAPVIHGARYSSFGRHFTKVEKLEEIVNKLHCYVKDGDTVVDFCCGSNDFSLLMSKKLDTMGKRCSFKNYDLIQPKDDFCFEKRDWMTTEPKELPPGSQLIMGLNPPFGVQASLANKFIDKALTFRPKLLILIVPEETIGLDRKRHPYELIWKDDSMLSGKSFYLPGSVDVNDKQIEQWNNSTPPLYLWSRPDWTDRHKRIAEEKGHILGNKQERIHMGETSAEPIISNYLMEENHDCYGDFSNIMDTTGDISRILDDVPEENDESGVSVPINSFPKKLNKKFIIRRNNIIEKQNPEKKQKTQSHGRLDPKLNKMDMELSFSPRSLSNYNEKNLPNLQPSSPLVHDPKIGAKVEGGGASSFSNSGYSRNLISEEVSSTESFHESSSTHVGPNILPNYPNSMFQYGSLSRSSFTYQGPTPYNAGAYKNYSVHDDDTAYAYPGSAAYRYPNYSGVYDLPYNYSGATSDPCVYPGSTAYPPPPPPLPMYDLNSMNADLRPPGVNTIDDYTSPEIVYGSTRWTPSEYLDPTMSG